MNESVFNREIEALVQIRHRNIVKLFGYCSSSQGRFLIYEYMERGNLAETLRANERAIELDWKRRINIVLDVVHALAYMHHDCPSPIVHRDITSNNILLDLEFRACISDFGMAKILNVNGLNITRLAGTKGYIAPGKNKIDPYLYYFLDLRYVLYMLLLHMSSPAVIDVSM